MISGSFRPFTTGSIWSDLRSSSRNRISWFSRKSFGCPAIDGICGFSRVAVGAMAGRAELKPVLRNDERRKKGGEQEGPPPLAEQKHYFVFFAAAFGRW